MARFKTTVYVEEGTMADLRAAAEHQGRPVAALVRDALAEYGRKTAPARRPKSIGIIRGGRTLSAEEINKMVSDAIWEKHQRRRGSR